MANRLNVLFLVADDMMPQLGSFYGVDFPSPVHPKMHTPGLDRLASRSLLLKRAYVQQALCAPSRTSLLTGRRPDTTHVYDLSQYWREVGGNFTTIPQYFKDNGYSTIGMGKIFHKGQSSGDDDPTSWSEPYFQPPNFDFWDSQERSWEAVSLDARKAKPFSDDQLLDRALTTLQNVAPRALAGVQPFFLAVGFRRPHLPFVFPDEFLKYYPEEDIRVPDNQFAPVNMPDVAWSSYGELRLFNDIAQLHPTGNINTTLPSVVVRNLRRAYYSALSFTDSLIEILLSELDNLGLRDSTIVSFWGDHGCHT